jgi:HPt (histidine-containing phosphotransfer) domain-containing protein
MEISKEAKQRYIARRSENHQILSDALSKQSSSEFKMIGHQLKGNARTFGFVELEDLGIELEKIGESHDWNSATSLLHKLKAWIDQKAKE